MAESTQKFLVDSPRKFLCVCHGGNNRSAALSRVLHDQFGQEAVPIGYSRHTDASLNYFCEWADYIVPMNREIADYIPPKYSEKIRVVDVGEDNYGTPYHPLLTERMWAVAMEWQQHDFRI